MREGRVVETVPVTDEDRRGDPDACELSTEGLSGLRRAHRELRPRRSDLGVREAHRIDGEGRGRAARRRVRRAAQPRMRLRVSVHQRLDDADVVGTAAEREDVCGRSGAVGSARIDRPPPETNTPPSYPERADGHRIAAAGDGLLLFEVLLRGRVARPADGSGSRAPPPPSASELRRRRPLPPPRPPCSGSRSVEARRSRRRRLGRHGGDHALAESRFGGRAARAAPVVARRIGGGTGAPGSAWRWRSAPLAFELDGSEEIVDGLMARPQERPAPPPSSGPGARRARREPARATACDRRRRLHERVAMVSSGC